MVGPVDNRPSNDYLHPFVQEKEEQMFFYMLHVTHDTWHMTCDMWQMVGCEYSLKTSAPYFLRIGCNDRVEGLDEKDRPLSQLMNEYQRCL